MEGHTQWIIHGNTILKGVTNNKIQKPRLLLPVMDFRLLDANNTTPDNETIAEKIYQWETGLSSSLGWTSETSEYWVPQVLDYLFQCRPTPDPWFHGEDDAPYVIVGFYDTPTSGSTPVSAQSHAVPSNKFLYETNVDSNDVECIHYSTTPNGTWLRMGPMTPDEMRTLIAEKSRCAPQNENPHHKRVDAAASSRWTMLSFTIKEDVHGNTRCLDWRRYHQQHSKVVGEMIQHATAISGTNERRLQVDQEVQFTWGLKGHGTKGTGSSSVVSAPHGAPSTSRTATSTASTPSEVVATIASSSARGDTPKGNPYGGSGKGRSVRWGNQTAMWGSWGSTDSAPTDRPPGTRRQHEEDQYGGKGQKAKHARTEGKAGYAAHQQGHLFTVLPVSESESESIPPLAASEESDDNYSIPSRVYAWTESEPEVAPDIEHSEHSSDEEGFTPEAYLSSLMTQSKNAPRFDPLEGAKKGYFTARERNKLSDNYNELVIEREALRSCLDIQDISDWNPNRENESQLFVSVTGNFIKSSKARFADQEIFDHQCKIVTLSSLEQANDDNDSPDHRMFCIIDVSNMDSQAREVVFHFLRKHLSEGGSHLIIGGHDQICCDENFHTHLDATNALTLRSPEYTRCPGDFEFVTDDPTVRFAVQEWAGQPQTDAHSSKSIHDLAKLEHLYMFAEAIDKSLVSVTLDARASRAFMGEWKVELQLERGCLDECYDKQDFSKEALPYGAKLLKNRSVV